MKFLCDNCKAKYQIADEKVAGKTVRMKCRKCGHQIEVRAAVTETSVASPPPRGPSGAPPRAPQKAGLATSLSATKPRSPSTSGIPPRGALAGAFTSNVQDAPSSTSGEAAAPNVEVSVTDEWYVAINGVPVGPVRISELRRRAAKGDVTEESLCWQEGLEEWRPIRSIAELAAIVREAAAGNRPSLIAPEPPRTSLAPRTPSAPAAPRASIPAAPRPLSPSVAPAPPARSNVVPLRPAATASFEDLGKGAAAAIAAPSPLIVTPAPSMAPDPFALPPPAAAPAPQPFNPMLSGPSMAPAPAPAYEAQKRGVPLWFYPVLVLALGFGSGVAFIVFRPQPAPAPVVIQMPSPTAAAPTTSDKTETPAPAASGDPAVVVSAEVKGKAAPVAAKLAGAKATADVPEKKGLDLGGLVSGGAGGPTAGPNAAAGAGASGGLDQAGVERVVSVHRNGVKRTCWERGGADQKSSVNVTISANVAANGTVASTSSSGDDPVVAKCIESQVKTWQFPAPGAPTTINIPFKFVRQ